jgi:serine/threonine-protein kinase
VSVLDPHRWRLIGPYLDQALDFLDETEREAWLVSLSEREPSIAAQLRVLLDEHRAASRDRYLERDAADMRRTDPPPATLAGQTIGAYTVLALIGTGGMSAVWLAERSDGRFERRAAIKFLNISLGRSGEERFTREGAILARLTHPHIAQLLDAGVAPTGQPYLVLEHVDGEHIDQYMRRHRLDTSARIRLFLDVLGAVAFAHANLIVHRDLKPSNVLVDGDGHVKLLDFGIAKLLEHEGASVEATLLTREGGVALTPAYAAPEQLTGAPITTATDIYALGVLLYVLVTGEHPAGANPTSAADMVKAVVETMPKQLPAGDLGTILGKALKKRPQERYVSVTALADDLQRYLNREPISARPDTLAYRTSKFIRRHQLGVAVAAAVLVGLSIALYAVNRQRAIAQRRFTEVRQLAAKLFDVDVRVRRLQGSSMTRQFIVDTALDYLRQLTPDAGDDPDLALDVGTAYMRVARVEGVAISPNLGQNEQAAEHLQIAEDFINRVLAAQPGNRTAMLRSAQIAHDRMIVAGQKRQPDEAFRLGQIAGQRLQRYLSTGDIQASEADQVVITYMNVANRYLLVGQYGDAIRMSQRTIEIAKATNQPWQVGPALTVVARAELGSGHLDEAFAAAHEASRSLETVSGETVTRKLQYALALIREAAILADPDSVNLGRPADAVPLLEKSFQIEEDIASRDPADFNSREQIPLTARLLSPLLVDSDPARALAMCDWSLRRTAEVKNNNTIARLDEVSMLAASTYPLRALHRTAEARSRLDDALSRLKQLGRYPAGEIQAGSEADDVLSALAEQEAAEGRIARAIEVSRDLLNRVMAAKPEAESKLAEAVEISRILASLARLERLAGHSTDAEALDDRRRRLWQHWSEKQPGNPFAARQLAAVGLPH